MLYSSRKDRKSVLARFIGQGPAASIVMIRIIEITQTGCELA